MSARQKKRFYLLLAGVMLVLFAAGLIAGYNGRGIPLCKDGKPPLQQQDTGIGQIEYLCHNGQLVTK